MHISVIRYRDELGGNATALRIRRAPSVWNDPLPQLVGLQRLTIELSVYPPDPAEVGNVVRSSTWVNLLFEIPQGRIAYEPYGMWLELGII